MDPTVIVLVVVAAVLLIAVVALGVIATRRRRSDKLREQFGPEYERSVADTGDRRAAEAELAARRDRRRDLDVRELDADERERFGQEWNRVQRGFVDDPTRALQDADRLVVDVMRTRGYPVDDFDRRAEDVSVDHPDVVHHYREARGVHDDARSGPVDTERQRRALTAYRALVTALLGDRAAGGAAGNGYPDRDGHPRGADDAPRSTSEERTR